MLGNIMSSIMPTRQNDNNHSEAGFSLIEVALALVVIGMLVTPWLVYTNAKEKLGLFEDTGSRMARSEISINQFFFSGNGRYPCPASLITDGDDVLHGHSYDTCADLSTIRICTNADWRLNEGICKTTDVEATAVLIGAIPFATLKIEEKESLDYWNNKMLYAVTYQKTKAADFNSNQGVIRVWSYKDDDNNNATPSIPANVSAILSDPVDFIFVSMGENGVGAYTADGVSAGACNNPANITESMNCDMDEVFFLDEHPKDSKEGSRSYQDNNSYYDDLTRFQVSVPQDIWFQHPSNPDHIMTLSVKVGVGTDAPVTTLDVAGNIRANGGVKAKELCGPNHTDVDEYCVKPQFITEKSICAANFEAGVVQVQENKLDCASGVDDASGNKLGKGTYKFDAAYKATACPTNTLQRGFYASGEPICE